MLKLKRMLCVLTAALMLAAALVSVAGAEESFKKGLAYLLSGSTVYADAQGQEPLFRVTSDTGVYVVENATGNGKTLKSNDMLRVAIALEGKADELYVWAYDISYMTKKQINSYSPGRGVGVYGVIIGNAQTTEAATPRPQVTRDPNKATAAPKTTAAPKATEAKRTATPAKATATPKPTPKVTATPKVTSTPEPIYAAFIAAQPEPVTGQLGAPVTLSVIAENAVALQWQYQETGKDWMNLPKNDTYAGSDTDTMTFVLTEENAAWRYRCVVTGAGNTLVTDEVGITLSTAVAVLEQPQDVIAALGDLAVLKVQAVNAAKWQWQQSTDGETWTDVEGGEVNDREGSLSVPVTDAIKGVRFRCVLTGVDGDTLETESASVITGAAARIITQPEDVSAASGTSAMLHVEAENAVSYQWQYDDGISGWWDLVERDDRVGTTTDTLTLSVRPTVASFTYRCVVYGVENEVATRTVTITIK